MPNNKMWKTVFKYAAGVVGFVIVLIAGWFAPGWYNEWQDEKLFNQVTLGSRENIQFLDTESLDIAGRIRALGESVNFNWGMSYYIDEYDMSADEILKKIKSRLDVWEQSGLVPEIYVSVLKEGQAECYGDKYFIELDGGMLPVYFLRFWDEEHITSLTVVMDSEKELLYYTSLSGYRGSEYVVECLGYDSVYDAASSIINGKTAGKQRTEYDFAGVCGAKSADISEVEGQLDCNAVLKFENFNGYAGRRFISTDVGYGVATMYGTERWMQFVEEVAMSMGCTEYHCPIEEWAAMALGQDEENVSFEDIIKLPAKEQEEAYEKK